MALITDSANEYSNLMRLSPGRPVPSGFTLISAAAPAVLQQICRTLTLARGLTIYEVWDEWNQLATGYLVPSFIAALASEYNRQGFSTERWNELRLHQRNTLKHAYTLLIERFPRIPEISATRVAERAEREHWNGDKKKLEERVVSHVRHEWTSYEIRLEHFERQPQSMNHLTGTPQTRLRKKKEEVREIVKPRSREILLSWLPQAIGSGELIKFWKRHQLLDETDGQGERSKQGIVVQTSSLLDYGGSETPANLLTETELIM